MRDLLLWGWQMFDSAVQVGIMLALVGIYRLAKGATENELEQQAGGLPEIN